LAAVDRAEGALRELILGGELAAGERLGEVELAETLGMSRTPVREALRRLSSQGLVEVTSNKGARVTAWTDREVEQTFLLRARLEGLAAAETARLATPEQVERLDALAHEMVPVALPLQTCDLSRLTELNAAFHGLLLEVAGSSTLAAALGGLVHASVLSRTQHSFDEAAMQRSVQHHLEIVAAVRARDPEWAESVMHSHLLSARASLLGPRTHRTARLHDSDT
jgi:DNA-binding GntR family transcriptional regulator